MRRVATLALAALVAGCGGSTYGPPLEGPGCQEDGAYEITVVIADDLAEIRRLYPDELGRKEILKGFAFQKKADLGTRKHSLVVLLPRGQNDRDRIETWGHELMHAVCGAWHPVSANG